MGWLMIASLLYLSGVICLAVSLNENQSPRRIVRETLRRWVKFLLCTFIIALAVHFLSM
jgi:hypothetical protein